MAVIVIVDWDRNGFGAVWVYLRKRGEGGHPAACCLGRRSQQREEEGPTSPTAYQSESPTVPSAGVEEEEEDELDPVSSDASMRARMFLADVESQKSWEGLEDFSWFRLGLGCHFSGAKLSMRNSASNWSSEMSGRTQAGGCPFLPSKERVVRLRQPWISVSSPHGPAFGGYLCLRGQSIGSASWACSLEEWKTFSWTRVNKVG